MKVVFADTFYSLALLNKNDEAHARAFNYLNQFSGKLITSEWILLELADGLATSRHRDAFSITRTELLAADSVEVVPLDMAIHEEAIALYANRRDKNWSLTDCVSFVIMRQKGIAEALTGDAHFEQAGFRALLK